MVSNNHESTNLRCYCRLEQESINSRDWKRMLYSNGKKCHMQKERIFKMNFLIGELDEM